MKRIFIIFNPISAGVVRNPIHAKWRGQKYPTHLTSVLNIQWSWNLVWIVTTINEVDSQIFVVNSGSTFCWRQQNFTS